MTEYTKMKKMKKPELQALLKARGLPSSGNKDVLISRLQDNDAAPRAQPQSQQEQEDQPPLLQGTLEALQSSDPREVAASLRKFVHAKYMQIAAKSLEKDLNSRRHDPWRLMMNADKLRAGKCSEPTCPLCGTGTLLDSLDRLCGSGSKCTDKTCKDLTNCSNCRRQIQELEDLYKQRKRQDCVDGSCGDVFTCLKCEKCIQRAMVPLGSLPDENSGPLDPEMSGDGTKLRSFMAGLRNLVHNECLTRLLRKLQDKKPDACEWINIKRELVAGKCLASTCCLCNDVTISKSLEGLSHGRQTDCENKKSTQCSEIFTCLSCRKATQDMEDNLSRYDHGHCKSGRCDEFSNCSVCHARLVAEDSSRDSSCQYEEDSNSDDEAKYCVEDDDCGGIKTCDFCRAEKCMDKLKQAERADHEKRMRRFDRLGHCDGPDPDESDEELLRYGLGCRFLDCEKCRMIEANIGPKMRNDWLRNRRVNNTMTSLTESSDGTMIGASRKRRFSNLDLHYPLRPEHPLAKRIREEKGREKLEREKARSQHERPSWFGTPEDPLPDLWMGRPVLPEEEIRGLKLLESLPKFYLSQSEEDQILLATGRKDKLFCTIIRRLEAELVSRDFWMQSLGFDADDGHGNIPADWRNRKENLLKAKNRAV
ncbi:hypothetical protein E4T49_08385 [Aureobasidium sp. EXF-10728]|nr:hypothetical protein E4T49_08385 [Aureobasidium sp. EXF-10728]